MLFIALCAESNLFSPLKYPLFNIVPKMRKNFSHITNSFPPFSNFVFQKNKWLVAISNQGLLSKPELVSGYILMATFGTKNVHSEVANFGNKLSSVIQNL